MDAYLETNMDMKEKKYICIEKKDRVETGELYQSDRVGFF